MSILYLAIKEGLLECAFTSSLSITGTELCTEVYLILYLLHPLKNDHFIPNN